MGGEELGRDKGYLFLEKLKLMKKASLDWAKQKKDSEEEALQQIEEELDQLENSEEDGYETS